ncbi:MAG: gamma-glutamylcyclotransferase family protein [Chloroflexota bacterium]
MYYFAYGSNLSKKQMRVKCPGAKALFTATLPNYKLVFIGWSREHKSAVATIRPFRGERVNGGVYELTEADARTLDRFEGVPAGYTRINVTVFDDSHRPVEAFSYIKPRQEAEGKPSEEYLRVIREGYLDWGLI